MKSEILQAVFSAPARPKHIKTTKAFILSSSVSCLFFSTLAHAESYGSRRQMIDLTNQPPQQITAGPNTDREISVSPSGLKNNNFMVRPEISLTGEAKIQLQEMVRECENQPDADKFYNKVPISIHVFPSYERTHVEQLLKKNKNSAANTVTVNNLPLYGFQFSLPDKDEKIYYPRNLFSYSADPIALSTFSSDSVIDIFLSGNCQYFESIKIRGRIPGMEAQALVSYTSFKSSAIAASATAFLLSDQAQKLFSKSKNEGRLTFNQSSRGSASGLLLGVFGSRSSQKSEGGLVDTRSRWVTADVLREASASYYASITGSIKEDGLSVAPLEKRIDNFVDLFLKKISTQTATIPLEESQFSDMEQDIDYIPSNQGETRKQIINAVQSAKASQSTSISVDNCLQKIIGTTNPTAAAATKASEIAKTVKNESPDSTEKTTNETDQSEPTVVSEKVSPPPKSGDTCKVDSSTKAIGGVNFKFDGLQNSWIPISLDVHKIDKKQWESQVELSIQNIKLSENESRKWITIADAKTTRLTTSDQVNNLINRQWHDVKKERKAGKTYINTKPYPIAVSVVETASGVVSGTSQNRCAVWITVDGKKIGHSHDNGTHGARICSVFVIVPPQKSYMVTTGAHGIPKNRSVNRWTELF